MGLTLETIYTSLWRYIPRPANRYASIYRFTSIYRFWDSVHVILWLCFTAVKAEGTLDFLGIFFSLCMVHLL